MKIYKLALDEALECRIIQTKHQKDEIMLVSIIVYNIKSNIAENILTLKEMHAGGISFSIISSSVEEYVTLMQSLILLKVKQLQKQNVNAAMMNCVCFSLFYNLS